MLVLFWTFLADLFLYSFEAEFIQRLVHEKKIIRRGLQPTLKYSYAVNVLTMVTVIPTSTCYITLNL